MANNFRNPLNVKFACSKLCNLKLLISDIARAIAVALTFALTTQIYDFFILRIDVSLLIRWSQVSRNVLFCVLPSS